jgi:endonuclease-3
VTADEAVGGTYTLVVELLEAASIEVGALGTSEFDPGWYAYTGSALGAGGFSRVERHEELAAGARDTRHWHIDYLLGHSDSTIDAVLTSDGADIECAVAAAIDGDPVADFGCSDCACDSHLYYGTRRASLLESVRRAHHSHRCADGDCRSHI